jgi:hypothetical protein
MATNHSHRPVRRSNTDAFVAKVEAVRHFLDCSVCIHDYTGELEASAGSAWRIHLNPFCTAVKRGNATRDERCRRCDIELVKDRLAVGPSTFLKYCHCDVAETVAPVLYNNRLLGAIFAGPFRWPDDDPLPDAALEQERPARLSRDLQEIHQGLPSLDGKKIRHVEAICRMLSDSLSRLVARTRTKPAEERGHAELISGFFAARFADQVHISDLADLKLHTGQTFPQLLKQTRLDHARVLLERSWFSITQVAAMCGYLDPTYFHRVFKDELGMTPRRWREERMVVGNVEA